MITSSLSTQGQITIPTQYRKYLDLQPGKTVVWEEDRDALGIKYLKVYKSGTDYLLSLKGVAKRYYESYGNGTTYLKKERTSWDKPSI